MKDYGISQFGSPSNTTLRSRSIYVSRNTSKHQVVYVRYNILKSVAKLNLAIIVAGGAWMYVSMQ